VELNNFNAINNMNAINSTGMKRKNTQSITFTGKFREKITDLSKNLKSAIFDKKAPDDIVIPDSIALSKIQNQRDAFIEEVFEAPDEGCRFSDFETRVLSCAKTFKEFGTQGVPLKYPRCEFSKKVQRIFVSEVPEPDRRAELTSKLNIKPLIRFGYIGYDGMLDISKLNCADRTERRLFGEGYKFLYENRAQTGDKEADELVNTIIKGLPEFLNVTGKKQNSSHNYSVDLHSLSVLANIINDPEYQTLSNEGKFVLKMTALLHDTGKREGSLDPEHPYKSLKLCAPILEKYNLDDKLKERLLKSIKNHQWLQWYNQSGADEDVIAKLVDDYEFAEDYTMAKIMSRADLKATSVDINSAFSCLLEDDYQKPLQAAVLEKFGTL